MPKENKQRGRREKRKRPEEPEIPEVPAKKSKPAKEEDTFQNGGSDSIPLDSGANNLAGLNVNDTAEDGTERPFYGMLDDEEQEYFRRADELLEVNDFPSDEERSMFLANVFKEAQGKELKIANSQSCSRLMERLILLSTPAQKKKLFEVFSGNFSHLIQHRFASHCCETLFIQSAPVVTEELTGVTPQSEGEMVEGVDAVFVSMENLFLYTLNELENQMIFLLTDRFASHTLRVLLIVLSGLPLSKSSTKSLLQSKKKERIEISNYDAAAGELSLAARTVPDSFSFAISKIITDTVATLDTSFIRVLATHPSGNPCLQLLLELELTQQSKSKGAALQPGSIISKLLPDDIETGGGESATFINGIVYEPIGSRLLETIMTHAPGKLFKQIYKSTFRERIGNLARNEIASFVVIKVLQRLSKDDLEEAVTLIIPQLPSLIERHRTTVIKTLIERCYKRHAFESIAKLTEAIAEGYGNDPATLVTKMTQFSPPQPQTDRNAQIPESRPSADALHGSLLAQAMLAVPNAPTNLIQDSLLAVNSTTILQLGLNTTTSHILQAALLPTPQNLTFRRKLVNLLLTSTSTTTSTDPTSGESTTDPELANEQPGILTLALSKPGSHTLDALFTGTTGLMVLKERMATILSDSEHELRDDFCGRVVWRNWMLDLFQRKRADWINKVKTGEGGSAISASKNAGAVKITPGVVSSQTETPAQAKMNATKPATAVGTGGGKGGKKADGKTALQLARERFVTAKAGGAPGTTINALKGKKFRPTGANAGVVQSRD